MEPKSAKELFQGIEQALDELELDDDQPISDLLEALEEQAEEEE